MKLEKKHWIIIGIVVAIILVWYFFLRKKKAESGFGMVNRMASPCPAGCSCSGGTVLCRGTESGYGTDLVSPGCPLGCRIDYERNVCICGGESNWKVETRDPKLELKALMNISPENTSIFATPVTLKK